MKTRNTASRPLSKADFKIPALLVLLSIVPLLGGIARFSSMSPGAAVTVENARFINSPIPIVLHIASASLYSILGAFLFSKVFRLRWPGLHRHAGRWLAACGIVAGATGLWMTVVFDIPVHHQGPLLYGVRVLVGTAMIASIVIAWRSILRRDVTRHEAYMIRAYALGQGAGTQVLVLLPWMLVSGQSGGIVRDLLMTLSWVINIVIAEVIIARRGPTSVARGAASLARVDGPAIVPEQA